MMNLRLSFVTAAAATLLSSSILAQAPTGAGPQLQNAVVRVIRARQSSVVSLHVVERPSEKGIAEALGSAVVVAAGGLLVTNAHVIESASAVHIRTVDGRDILTTILARDPESDLALLRSSDATGLVPTGLADSDAAPVGTFVVAIGNPYGLHHSVTFGVISAKARGLDDSGLEFLQTDAAVNPGSSGGGLFDLQGRLLGITSGILTPPGGGNVGLNFAIPVNVLKALLPQLEAGEVRHGWIGASMRGTKTAGLSAVTGVALEVLAVSPGSPAEAAGLRPGDVVLRARSPRAIPAARLHEAVWLSRPGTHFVLDVLRNGVPQILTVVTVQQMRQ